MNKFIEKKLNWPLISRVMKWHFNHYIRRIDAPIIAAFQLTNHCNLKCGMCTLWKNQKKAVFDLAVFKKTIDELSYLGCYYITLSGGEPLVIKNIEEYVCYAKERIPFINLVTNGFALDEHMAKRLSIAKINMLCVSIDGFRETHDRIRGLNGAFDRAIRAIGNVKMYMPDSQITVNTVISSYNIDELFDFVDFVQNLKVFQKFQPIYKHPEFAEMDGKQILDASMNKSQIEKTKKLVKSLKKKKNVLNSGYFLDKIPGYFAGENSKGLFIKKCKSVNYYCEMRENSEVYPCLEGLGWKGGFSLNGGLKKVFYSKPYRDTVNQLKDCMRCQEILPVCYIEPRITFPIGNYLRYTLLFNFLNTKRGIEHGTV